MGRTTLGYFLLAPALLLLTACGVSDERVLRSEFAVPRSARLLSLASSPEPGWFGREGLTIDAEFELDAAQRDDYFVAVQADERWQALPPSEEFLARMFGLGTYRRGFERTREVIGEVAPELQRPELPTDAELLSKWSAELPLEVPGGIYSCRTAGNDLMRAERVPCESRAGDLNDFMFGVLNPATGRLRIRVQTAY